MRQNGRKCFYLKWAIPGLFFFIFIFSTQLTKNKCLIKVCRRLDSNRGSLVSKAAALPTEPQPLPLCCITILFANSLVYWPHFFSVSTTTLFTFSLVSSLFRYFCRNDLLVKLNCLPWVVFPLTFMFIASLFIYLFV